MKFTHLIFKLFFFENYAAYVLYDNSISLAFLKFFRNNENKE